MGVFDLSGQQMYTAYTNGETPIDLLTLGQAALAARLKGEQGLSQEEANYAADFLLTYAEEQLRQAKGS